MKAEAEIRERFRDIAQQWQKLRAAGRNLNNDYEAAQVHHWFFCLAETLEFTRRERETLDDYIARACFPSLPERGD